MVFVSSFHHRGGVVFCCSWRDGAFVFFFEAGRGGCFFSEAGRGGVFFFRGGTRRFFFFSEAGRDGAVFFFFSRGGTGRLFLAVAFFLAGRGKIGPAKGGLNRPASRPCKALCCCCCCHPICCLRRNVSLDTLLKTRDGATHPFHCGTCLRFFIARRVRPSLSLVDVEVEFTHDKLVALHVLGIV